MGAKNKIKTGKVSSGSFGIKGVDDRAAPAGNPAWPPPKSPLGQAIAYTLSRWEGLSAYPLPAQIEIDRTANRNNLVKNVIRPLAIGRKVFLFSGSHQAAEMAAAMYSFYGDMQEKWR